jgi:predicted RNA-binding Zn ribbon-like protein
VVKIWPRRAAGDQRWRTAKVAANAGPSATDLVNTERQGRDELDGLDALRRLLAAHGEEEPIDLDERDLDGARTLRARLRPVFGAGDPAAAAAALNRLLADTAVSPRLSDHDGSAWHLHVARPDASWSEWLAATTATGLAVLVAEHGFDRLGRCAAARCGTVFVDTSRGGGRRWCSDTCANRARVAAFRARSRG